MTRFMSLKRSFLAGLVLILPLVVTLYILQLLAGIVLQFIDPVVAQTNLASYTANVELAAQLITGVLLLIVITVLGYVAQNRVGQRLFGNLGQLVGLIPLVRVIYSTTRQMSTTLSSRETSYESLVLLEFPRKGVYSIGLITADSPRAVDEAVDANVRNVFLPSSPNPTSGRLVLAPEDEIVEVELSTRQGLRLLMTTGIGAEDDPIPADVAAKLPAIDEDIDGDIDEKTDEEKA